MKLNISSEAKGKIMTTDCQWGPQPLIIFTRIYAVVNSAICIMADRYNGRQQYEEEKGNRRHSHYSTQILQQKKMMII